MARGRNWEAELAEIEVIAEPDRRTLIGLIEDTRHIVEALERHPQIDAALPTGGELHDLAGSLAAANAAYLLAVDPTDGELVPRTHFVIAEMTAALEFLFRHESDAGSAAGDRELDRLGSVHPAEPDGAAALAAKLDDYLALAAAHRHGLGRVPGFEESLLDEARELSGELKRRGPAGERTVEARTLFLRRNRLATLLFLKLSRVRTLNPDTSGP